MPLAATAVHPTMQTSAAPAFPNGSQYAGAYTLVFQIRHVASKTLLKRHHLILFPQHFSQETEARTSLYYTKGGIVADTPLGQGIGATIFQIAGHTGYAGVREPGNAPLLDRMTAPASVQGFITTVQTVVGSVGRELPVQTTRVDGAAAIKDLQDTIRLYFAPDQGELAGAGITQTQDLQLEFLNFSAPTSAQNRTGLTGWVIHPHRNLVSLRQEATRPFLYFYTFQFAGIRPLTEVTLADPFLQTFGQPATGLRAVLGRLSAVVRDVTNGVNTISDAFTQLVSQQVTGPIGTLLLNTAQLGDAVTGFVQGSAAKITFPLYAQRLVADVLEVPSHSVTTLQAAATQLSGLLSAASAGTSRSTLGAGTVVVAGVNDRLTLAVNGEALTVDLGTQSSGPAIAAALQAAVRAAAPQHAANAAAYRDFTATYATGQYTLASGTALSDAASVTVAVNVDSLLTPTDASATLGLGADNGGLEHAGSAYGVPALALLRGLERACSTLQAFPDYFADQLADQDAQVAALLPADSTRAQIRGAQRLASTRLTSGDSLQGVAARVGVPWETLALVNRLTYPYIVQAPAVLGQGRVGSANTWTLTDPTQTWSVNGFQGQQVVIQAGRGAGQTRGILTNTATTLVVAQAWDPLPDFTSDYTIQQASSDVLTTGTVTAVTAQTLTDSTLVLVPNSQRGLRLHLLAGSAAGERRRIVTHTATTYTLDVPWQVVPPVGSVYAVERPPSHGLTSQRVLGDPLQVPRPSGVAPPGPIRSRLQDVSAITGRALSTEEKLFGRDLLLTDGALVWDAAAGDMVTIAGLPNLRQAVIHLVNVPIGQVEYLPGLGSYVHEELGLVATLPTQFHLLQSVERTITQDSRIARLGGAEVLTQGGRTLVSFAATAITGASIDRVVIR